MPSLGEKGQKTIKVSQNFSEPLTDRRIEGISWMVKMTIGDYLTMADITGNRYQRNLQNLSFYKKLIQDLLNDTTMPPISVIYPERNINFKEGLAINNKFIILDGLQRTNCLLECIDIISKGKSEGKYKSVEEFKNKLIYVEIWEKMDLKNILYKMVVLNTGQKKMDYEHQLDILSDSVKIKLNEMGVIYYLKADRGTREIKNDEFELSTITAGLVSFLNKSPIPGKKNAAEFLFNRFDISIEANELDNSLNLISDVATYDYLKWVLVDFDRLLSERYGSKNPLRNYDVFMISLLASIGYSYSRKPEVLKEKIRNLEELFRKEEDPIKLNLFEVIYKSFSSGIGDKRRRFIFNSFKFYFLSPQFDDEFTWSEDYV